jgi:hypothetical protein
MRERRKDRIDYVVRTVFSPSGEQLRLAPLPAGLRGLYLPMRIAYTGAQSAWRLLRAAARWPRIALNG